MKHPPAGQAANPRRLVDTGKPPQADHRWLQISFDVPSQSAPTFSELLSDAGALAVTLKDAGNEPVLEPAPGTTPLWTCTRVVGLFDANVDAASLLEHLQSLQAEAGLPPHRIDHLPEQAWERLCMDEFKPMRFGSRLWVYPSWAIPPSSDAVSVRLDPGLAFGTGAHATTALCLEWLEGLPLQGRQLIDYGCGSGILAIAALKLGASRAWAVDTDPQALQATRRNAAENQVNGRLVATAPDKLAGITADVLVANILAEPLIELAPVFADHLSAGAWLGVSGLLRHQAARVSSGYRRWFDLDERVDRDEWCLLTGHRRGEGSH